jgi:hypothetical protein
LHGLLSRCLPLFAGGKDLPPRDTSFNTVRAVFLYPPPIPAGLTGMSRHLLVAVALRAVNFHPAHTVTVPAGRVLVTILPTEEMLV